jgi:hypothetical protein
LLLPGTRELRDAQVGRIEVHRPGRLRPENVLLELVVCRRRAPLNRLTDLIDRQAGRLGRFAGGDTFTTGGDRGNQDGAERQQTLHRKLTDSNPD